MARPVPVINDAVVQALIDSLDAEFAVPLMDTFLEDSPRRVEEMQQAMRAMDAELLHRAAHTLQSNARTFGLEQLAEFCRSLETLARTGDLSQAQALIQRVEIAYRAATNALEEERHKHAAK
ncbi:Hpt domain-containing protein [Streptomyces sp. NPDC090073]|uniref:Hpt domain-containing protein n=1 Tax=Streptomyces sp. NPDC090073 TaxID=3365936 RepID=UPI003823EF4A